MKQLIKKLLDIVRRALANDPGDTAERDKLRKEVAVLTAEKQEVESLTGEINEVIDLATAATPDGEPGDPTPTTGRSITLKASSVGQETMTTTLSNSGVDDERAAVLRGVFDEFKNGGLSVPPGGSKFESTLSFTDSGGESETVKFDNGDQKNASDVAGLKALLAIATAAAPTA